MRKTLIVSLLFALPLCAALAADGIDQLSERLIAMRSKVDALHERVNQKKEALRLKVSRYAQEKAELEGSVHKQRLALKQLEQDLAQTKAKIAGSNQKEQGLTPIVEQSLVALQSYVAASLPFKHNDRTKALGELAGQVKAGLLPPRRALIKTWSFLEDELRLTKEIGMYRDVLSINGKQELVDVAKLGMVAMFYRTQQGKIGSVRREGGETWAVTPLSGTEHEPQIIALFDALTAQNKSGYFTLPALVASTGSKTSPLPAASGVKGGAQ